MATAGEAERFKLGAGCQDKPGPGLEHGKMRMEERHKIEGNHRKKTICGGICLNIGQSKQLVIGHCDASVIRSSVTWHGIRARGGEGGRRGSRWGFRTT